jgi:tRNA (cytidine/uridine-2'-O-)-methyltransferase
MFHVVLYQPENPHNTGAIVRTCALLGASLHLVGPYGFAGFDDVHRSSMQYLGTGLLIEHESWDRFVDTCPAASRLFALWDRGGVAYTEPDYRDGDYFVFGQESSGLPDEVLAQCTTLRIPMPGAVVPRTDHRQHSLNVSVSVAMTLAVAAASLPPA